MAKRVSPVLVNLIYDALLKCFWYKESLKRYLRASGISTNAISHMDTADSKRTWLDGLFPKLVDHPKGAELLMAMARSLACMTTFPDLSRLEDSAFKIEAAKVAVAALAEALGAESEETAKAREAEERRKRSEEGLRTSARHQADLDQLRRRMEALTPALGTQKGGYDFERWFYDLLDYEEIDNRRPYKVDGRQIDGSLTLDGFTYLLELKFEAGHAGAPDIDSLKAKVDSKADNTMGVMVAVSGYSSVAVQEASGKKSVLLLLDVNHVYMVLGGIASIKEIIRRVRRHSSQTGRAYLAVAEFGG